jgi:hypothetical protein
MATKITGGGIFFNARIGHNILSTYSINPSKWIRLVNGVLCVATMKLPSILFYYYHYYYWVSSND